jgi:hypothetical protein
MQAQALRGLIHSWHPALDEGLACIPATVADLRHTLGRPGPRVGKGRSTKNRSIGVKRALMVKPTGRARNRRSGTDVDQAIWSRSVSGGIGMEVGRPG